MKAKRYPPRLHIILAREADTAIVIRRGPSKAACTLLWDRRKDRFELGQWLRGRMYERRCDLSPDGRYFIYFAMNGNRSSEVKGSWTAISKAPYLKAIGLWPKGDCWAGGGLFTGKSNYWLNQGPYESLAPMQLPAQLSCDSHRPFSVHFGYECPGIYYPRLQRDGWTLTGHESEGGDRMSFFEKKLPKGWVLRKTAHATINHPVGKGCYFDTHALIHHDTDKEIDCGEWEWADLDKERLVWTTKGCLFAGSITRSGLGEFKLLHDFNDMEFEAIEAPY